MDELVDISADFVPDNILHLFQCCTWDFGLSNLNGRRINFMFGIKQVADQAFGSQKLFMQGVCHYLKPEFVLTVDGSIKP